MKDRWSCFTREYKIKAKAPLSKKEICFLLLISYFANVSCKGPKQLISQPLIV